MAVTFKFPGQGEAHDGIKLRVLEFGFPRVECFLEVLVENGNC